MIDSETEACAVGATQDAEVRNSVILLTKRVSRLRSGGVADYLAMIIDPPSPANFTLTRIQVDKPFMSIEKGMLNVSTRKLAVSYNLIDVIDPSSDRLVSAKGSQEYSLIFRAIRLPRLSTDV